MGKEPSLTVAGTGMEESILQTVLDSCENTRTTITNIMKKSGDGHRNHNKPVKH